MPPFITWTQLRATTEPPLVAQGFLLPLFRCGVQENSTLRVVSATALPPAKQLPRCRFFRPLDFSIAGK